ncbi:sensor histidine kinase [Chryseolinea soli]|nr:histidine kinase [Chryseolinea soli]
MVAHILGGLAFLTIPILLSPRPSHMPFFSRPTLRDLLANVLMLVIFYLNYYFFIPRLYFRKKEVLYFTIIALGFLAISYAPSLMTGYIPWNASRELHPTVLSGLQTNPRMVDDAAYLTQVKHSIFLYMAVVLFSILLRIRTKLLSTETMKHVAELGILKNQINPHFLFNTLNNIYAYAIKEEAQITATSVLKLSGMMRYVVTETGKQFVSLEKEIMYTDDYIDLQKMRLTRSMHLSYAVIGRVDQLTIAPIILMPFIENAFKHGVNPDRESYISIRIEITDNNLELVVENQKVKTSPEQHTKSGVGVENTKSRLELLYPKKHSLVIRDDESHHRVRLNLILA